MGRCNRRHRQGRGQLASCGRVPVARPLPSCPGNRTAGGLTDAQAQLEPLIRAAGIRKVARRSGVPVTRIHDWLSGRRPVYLHRVEAIAEVVGVRLVFVATIPREAGRRSRP